MIVNIKKKYVLILFFLLMSLFSPHILHTNTSTPKWIINKPIIFNELRKKLTREYAKMHYGFDSLYIEPEMIVIHYTAGQSFKKDFALFNKINIHGRKYLKKYGQVNVSVHYMIDRDGTVYRLMDDNMMARHVIGLNHCSIGIENVGSADLTDAQLRSNAKLIRHLVKKYPGIKYLIGHYEYRNFEGTRLFVEKFSNYRTVKKDPGKQFMQKLRSLLKDLSLKNIYYKSSDLK